MFTSINTEPQTEQRTENIPAAAENDTITNPDTNTAEQQQHHENQGQQELSQENNDTTNDENPRIPYKSFKKKYRKLEYKFNQVMQTSDELHAQEVQATKIFNRLAREKARLLDTLETMRRYGNDHLPENSKIHIDESDDDATNVKLNTTGLHMSELLDHAYEYSSDENSQSTPKNPMSLLEWLKRNQPHVLTEQTFEKPANPANGSKKKKATTEKTSKKRKPSSASIDNQDDEDNNQSSKKMKKLSPQQQHPTIPV